MCHVVNAELSKAAAARSDDLQDGVGSNQVGHSRIHIYRIMNKSASFESWAWLLQAEDNSHDNSSQSFDFENA